jgi:hypothetical protein
MPIWEYKIITSGPLGFASPPLLEQHLNQLGKEEWEIIHFQTRPDNPLAFYGLARRSVARDWMVEATAAAPGLKSGAIPAPPEERSAPALDTAALRAEAEERRESLLAREESLRPLRDDAADAEDDDAGTAGRDTFEDEDLPTFFEAIRPHMRRNQRGPGMAASVEYLAKQFGQSEADLIEALKECGFTIPEGPKDPPAYLEHDGDLFWLNFNHRRQLWVNTREKPRPAFKTVAGTKLAPPEAGARQPEGEAGREEPTGGSTGHAAIREPASETPPAEPLPAGPALLDRLRPMMRRNRRDPGWSGSISYLARALKTERGTLEAAFDALGLTLTPDAGGQPVRVEIEGFTYWLNRDKSGQTWINAREVRETAPAAGGTPLTELPLPAPQGSPLAAVRLLLKENKRGGVAAEVGRLASQLEKSSEELLAALVGAGLKVPEKAREKPVFAEHAGEIFWLNRNARGELWLNAKASKYAGGAESDAPAAAPSADGTPGATERSRRPRKKKDDTSGS